MGLDGVVWASWLAGLVCVFVIGLLAVIEGRL